MLILYFSKTHRDGTRQWIMRASIEDDDNGDKGFYDVESYVFDDSTDSRNLNEIFDVDNTDDDNGNKVKFNPEKIKHLFFNIQAFSRICSPPHYRLYIDHTCVSNILKFNENIIDRLPKPVSLNTFVYEFTYLNRNKFKHLCLVNYDNFYDDIVADIDDDHRLNSIYNAKKSQILIKDLLKKKLSPSVLSNNNIYSNNSLLLVDNDDTLTQLKKEFGEAIFKIFEVEQFLKPWERFRISRNSELSNHYLGLDSENFSFCISNENRLIF